MHYMSYGSAGGKYPKTCRAAIVTEVREGDIGLAAINPTGIFFDRQVRHDEERDAGTWHWPTAACMGEE